MKIFDTNTPTPLTSHYLGGREVLVKREDLIHPFISGNKYRKLKYVLESILKKEFKTVVSFGGAYSNHIHALSYACNAVGLHLKLFIRGEKVKNPTLDFTEKQGAELHFIPRDQYREIKELKTIPKYPDAAVIPEGGSSPLSLKGIKEMMDEIELSNSQFCVSFGSGATSVGMLAALPADASLHVFSALKLPSFSKAFFQKSEELGVVSERVNLHSEFHFGGYAKWNEELINFMNSFDIDLDPIYTGKLFYGVRTLIEEGKLDNDRPIVLIHTGGLQGRIGFNERFGDILT